MRLIKIILVTGFVLLLSLSTYHGNARGEPNNDRENSCLRIGLTGDIMLGRLVNEIITAEGYLYPWGNTVELLKSTDLNLVNLETTLTKSNSRVAKTYNFKADPDRVQSLTAARIDICNIANNHILDFDEEGFFETLTTLENSGIQHIGAGRNINKAREPVVITKNGITVGIIGCTDNEPGWKAGKTRPGTFYVNIKKPQELLTEIKSIRPWVDILILTIHWGPNMRQKPTQAFVRFAHTMIDAGVDILHGHSAHVFQAIEIYNDRLILYDTGDFIDDYKTPPNLRTDQSFFYIVEVDLDGIVRLNLVPVLISNMQVNRATGTEYTQITDRIKTLSEDYNTVIIESSGILRVIVRKQPFDYFINRI